MINFKKFLLESNISISAIYNNKEDLLLDANIECSQFMWMIKSNKTFYRGDATFNSKLNNNLGGIIDTTGTNRRSKNGSNWYTLILDNHPEYKDFPKRSESLICSGEEYYASLYGANKDTKETNVYLVVPTNTAKIATINYIDIWDMNLDVFGNNINVQELNDFFDELKDFGLNDGDWQSFYYLDKLLKENDPQLYDTFAKAANKYLQIQTGDIPIFEHNFVNTIFKIYSLKNTKFELLTASKIRSSRDGYNRNEIWISGEILVINNNKWKQLKND